MPGRGQHDADRGEHRGPDRPETGSGGRRVGVRHGRVIIALRLGLPYGRSETSGASVAGPLRRPSARRVLEPIVVYTGARECHIGRMRAVAAAGGLRPTAGGNR
ncbi:hypothetical protein GCM10020254_44760 [Streptomyces goshikiensis]